MNGFDLGTVIAALEIMGKGMLGIFVTILIIMLCVMVMGKIGGKDSSQKDDNTQNGCNGSIG